MTVIAEYLGVASALIALIAAFALGRHIDALTDQLIGLRQLVATVQEAQSEQGRVLSELASFREALPDLRELGHQLTEGKNQQLELANTVAKLSSDLEIVREMEASIAQMKAEQIRIKHEFDQWRAELKSAATELAKLESSIR